MGVGAAARSKLLGNGRKDPGWWVREVLGDDPWEKQVEILEAVRDHDRVAVRSCHGIGKDWTAARALMWFLYNHDLSKAVSTAPTDRQVEGILWSEINVAHKRARFPLGGRCLTKKLQLEEDWFAVGFTTNDYDPDKAQGWHGKGGTFVLCDEATGIPQPIQDALEGVLSGANSKKLSIGNPTDANTPFGKEFTTPGIHKISISAFDTPNFTAFGITEEMIADGSWRDAIGDAELPRPYLITPAWVAHAHRNWGADSPMYQAKVLGQFPVFSTNTLFPLAWIEAAQARTLEPAGDPELGLDVARYGPDKTSCYLRRGPVYRRVFKSSKENLMETTGRARAACEQTGAQVIKVDVIGLGSGPVDRLNEMAGDPTDAFFVNAVGIDVGAAAQQTEPGAPKFFNLKAELFFGLSYLFRDGLIDLDPEDEDVAADLSAIRYIYTSTGELRIEEKSETKKLLGGSPDDAEALMLASARSIVVDYGNADLILTVPSTIASAADAPWNVG